MAKARRIFGNDQYNTKLQAIHGYDHNAPYMVHGLEEAPIVQRNPFTKSDGYKKAGIGDNQTLAIQKTPRDISQMRELVANYPEQFPIMDALSKYRGIKELGSEENNTHNTTFSDPSFAKELASCGHKSGQPYCNFTTKLGAKKAGDTETARALTGGSESSYKGMLANPNFDVQNLPQGQGEFIYLHDKDGKKHHTSAGIYDAASGKVYSIEGNSFGIAPNVKGEFEGVGETYDYYGKKDAFAQKKKSKAKELVGR